MPAAPPSALQEEWAEKKKKYEADVEDDTLNPDKDYLNTTAATNDAQEKKKAKKKKKEAAFGWEIFGADAMYNSYKKRVNRLHEDHGSDLKGSYAARKATEAEETFFPSADTLVTVGASTAVDDKGPVSCPPTLPSPLCKPAPSNQEHKPKEAGTVQIHMPDALRVRIRETATEQSGRTRALG